MEHTKIYAFCEQHYIRNLEIKYSGEMSKFGIPGSGVAVCEIEIDQEELIKLIEFETKAKSILKLLDEEKELRDKYTAVQKAYDEYQLLLTITQKEQNDI